MSDTRLNWTHLWEQIDELAGDSDRHAAILTMSCDLDLATARHFAYQGLLDGYRVWKTRQRSQAMQDEVESSDPAARRKQMIDEEFPVPGTKPTEWVRWADATIEQHTAREMNLRKLASGTLREAERHADAVNRIKEAGVTCLREIGVETESTVLPSAEASPASSRRRSMKVVA